MNRCSDCRYWYPLDIMPRLGECRSYQSPYFEKPVSNDRFSEGCFEVRSPNNDEEFTWCGTCRQTIHITEKDLHRSHAVYTGSAQLPAEEMREVTLPG